jgi:hypothetical protein
MLLLLTTLSAMPPVLLDDACVATKVAAKAGPTQLAFEVEPESVIIYVDSKKKGVAKKLKHVAVKPGTHTVRLVWNKDETEFDIKVEKGRTIVVKYAFEDSGAETPPPSEETPPAADEDSKKDAPKARQKEKGDEKEKDREKAPAPPPADDEPSDDLDSDIPH